jgi:hypothetical protein
MPFSDSTADAAEEPDSERAPGEGGGEEEAVEAGASGFSGSSDDVES